MHLCPLLRLTAKACDGSFIFSLMSISSFLSIYFNTHSHKLSILWQNDLFFHWDVKLKLADVVEEPLNRIAY